MDKTPILLGNTFPMSLVRRRVVITPLTLDDLRGALKLRGYRSFWGHENTAIAAEEMLGVRVRPEQERPAITLDDNGYPVLDKKIFRECWILSPNYTAGIRPAVGAEIGSGDIEGWNVLKMVWDA